MLKKIILGIFTISIFVGCSGVEAKKNFYNNSLMVQLNFAKTLPSFESGFADISIWKYKNKDDVSNIKTVIYEHIEHSQGDDTKKKLLINVDEAFEEDYNYYVLLKIYKDSNKDGKMEVIQGKSFGKNNGTINKTIKEISFFIDE